MALSVDHLLRTAATLEQASWAIERTPAEDAVMFDLFRMLHAYLQDVRALAVPLQGACDAAG